ncbi:MAG TPA: acyl-CoA dehydrogenase [Leptospiraceae bacterium]|nr:acyl-CoA dehydrogenase [Spirochaetaceae bacterium]HBS04400.1 acyl-CoA dehydrogenase [Leptospiraceae bacterium]|tara:strand:- start:26903 stop:28537 length:1635 start_codon:yes stop_codon:yes gene_type:complete
MEQHLQTIRNQFQASIKKITENLARRADDGGKLSISKMDENQLVHYNLAYHTAEFNIADYFLNYSDQNGDMEKDMASAFIGEAFNRFRGELAGRAEEYGLGPDEISGLFTQELNEAIQKSVEKSKYDRIAENVIAGQYGNLATEDYNEVRDVYRKIAEQTVMPHAEHVHRHDDFIPDDILSELINNGAFGLSIPEQYGGLLDMLGNVGMMVVTEELSRGGLSIAGSLITRPEILSKAIIKGGTEEQKEKWLGALASGERMAGVAVTEPNFGSDVAGMKVTADKVDGGWVLNGVKTWCTFAGYADVLLVLARTEKDPALKHKGLSILLAEKPRSKDHKFEVKQDGGGSMSGSAIATIGYRGMHSFEVNFDNYFVPDENLIGGEEGRGKGFYLQMAGFAGGRVQTAARANGVMQAAMEAAARYANERKVFGKELKEYQINRWKLAKMAMIVQASRQYSYHVAGLMDEGKGNMEATLVKFYASRISEWVTREAMQIHGGMGYAEEYPVSRYFVDARVFSIFEGAEEVMALRVCARELLQQVLQGAPA